MSNPEQEKRIALRKLYPDYTDEELAEAGETLSRYVGVVRRIYERLKRENPDLLTRELLNAKLKKPRRPFS